MAKSMLTSVSHVKSSFVTLD